MANSSDPVVFNSPGQEVEKKMKFDSVLPLIGEFGRYQKRVYLLLCLPAISCALHKLAWVFLGAKVAHRYDLQNYELKTHENSIGISQVSVATGIRGCCI